MPAELARDEAMFVRDLVYQCSAILLDDSKTYLIETRLEQLARDLGLSSPGEVVRSARGGSAALVTRIVEALATHETLFFRDHHPFELLRREVLPELIGLKEQTKTINIWSAACSSGQEPFSIGMLIREHFPQLATWNVKIIGTDLSEQVLARAREARFHHMEVNRGLPAPLLLKYFERQGTDWRLKPVIRDMVEFRKLNLLEPWLLRVQPDIVMLRNVLIYFDVARKREILGRALSLVPPHGVLFLGTAETTLNIHDGWQRAGVGTSSYFRVKR